MDRVRKHLTASAEAHRKAHLEALREAAVARAYQEAENPPSAPQGGLQPPPEGTWDTVGD